VRAQLLVGLFFGVAFGVGLALFGVPYALSLGVAGAVLELIPYLGGAVVTLVAMLIALTISPWLALGVLAVELVVATVESHLVYPKLVGDRVGIHPLVIIVALFIGAEAKGVLGVLLAVPVAIVLQVLFDQFYRFEAAEPEAETATHEPITATPQIAQPMTERHI
jgi:predicted PurR-regulated permease PerM